MNDEIERWIHGFRSGELSPSELAERLLSCEHRAEQLHQPDLDRHRRCGFPEVIYGSGKSAQAIFQIAEKLLDAGGEEILVTRVDNDLFRELHRSFPFERYDTLGRTLRLSKTSLPGTTLAEDFLSIAAPHVAVVTAGSTDLSVAREAIETLAWMKVPAVLVCDVGVAGPYRLLARIEELRRCVAVVVIAGMEGALASVAGGLVSVPVIAVPTSVGYGANLAGITTLLSMLSSCAANVTVVNIDSGFKGGYVAGLIARQVSVAVRSVKARAFTE